MPHWAPPLGASIGYEADLTPKAAPNSIWRMQIPIGQTRDVILVQGKGLEIRSNDPKIVSEPNTQNGVDINGRGRRLFGDNYNDVKISLRGDTIGTTTLDAWLNAVLYSRSLQVQVTEKATAKTGVFQLKNDLQKMVSEPNFKAISAYGRVHDRIVAASPEEKQEALRDQPFLSSLRAALFFNDFAKAVELLGRQAPAGRDLIKDPIVIGALDAAWKDSNVAAGYPNRREHGGYVFMNVITGQISTATTPPGNDWGSMKLPSPIPPENTICVAHFHTHPNPEQGFAQECSDGEPESFQADGVPGIVRAEKGPSTCGPERRLHLAGSRGYPGPSGGEAP